MAQYFELINNEIKMYVCSDVSDETFSLFADNMFDLGYSITPIPQYVFSDNSLEMNEAIVMWLEEDTLLDVIKCSENIKFLNDKRRNRA